MNRIAKITLIGSLTALLLGATAARADEHFTAPIAAPIASPTFVAPLGAYGQPEVVGYHRDDGQPQAVDFHRGYDGDLEGARVRFYRHWNGDRRERARFERWCAERRAENRRRDEHRGWRGDRD